MGGGYDRLGPCFCAAELKSGNMVLRDRHPVTCFLIVEHTNDEALIRKQVLRLLLANCGWLYFYGRHEPLWHWIADETFVRLHPSSNDDACCCTVDCPDIDDFVNELYLSVSAGSNDPHDTLLLYDDAGIYKNVLERLVSLRLQSPPHPRPLTVEKCNGQKKATIKPGDPPYKPTNYGEQKTAAGKEDRILGSFLLYN